MKKKNFKKIIFLNLILLIFGFSLQSLASYISKIYASEESMVAKFSVTESLGTIPLELDTLDAYHSLIYTFKVTNYDDQNLLTETHYKYRIYIETSENIPIAFVLKQNDGENLLNDKLSTNYFDMSFEAKKEEMYSLQISLKDSSYLNNNKIDYVILHFEAYQID